jgi:hypothetical protein
MIKKLFFLIIGLLVVNSAFSIEVADRWNYKFQKEVIINCTESEYFCDDLCGKKDQCVIKEKVCRDCLGSTVYLTHIFDQIGRSIVASEEAQIEDMIELLETKRFSAITSTSVYNMVDAMGDKKIEKRFASLCPTEEYKNPVVIFETQEVSGLLGRPKLVVCNNGENTKVFHVNPNGGVLVNP